MIDDEGNFKGNLKNTNSSIIKIKIRSVEGYPQHKSEFRLNDRKSIIREVELWKEKFGVDCIMINRNYLNEFKLQKDSEFNEEKKALDEWREKTKNLREIDTDMQKRLKKAFES